jgi:hypothetical protein
MAKMGLELLGGEQVIFKRKFRWGLEVQVCGNRTIPEHFVKLAARPNLSIEETEINMKNAKTWIPGKASWESITVTYYDVANVQDNKLIHLWEWLTSVYNFADPEGIRGQLNMGSALQDYRGQATIRMYSGCGDTLETWQLRDAWPQAVNFQDLDFAASEEMTIELTIRYSDVSYTNNCGRNLQPCDCTPCTQ